MRRLNMSNVEVWLPPEELLFYLRSHHISHIFIIMTNNQEASSLASKGTTQPYLPPFAGNSPFPHPYMYPPHGYWSTPTPSLPFTYPGNLIPTLPNDLDPKDPISYPYMDPPYPMYGYHQSSPFPSQPPQPTPPHGYPHPGYRQPPTTSSQTQPSLPQPNVIDSRQPKQTVPSIMN
ncbi:uncharacterized protein MELLADRAFT_95299 [Melampsora larici-populina 98AG31]|uniref:Uncharacterized protein n=1 Tax=Melampsora larici-populina (strain 98AG31 / pathotype 3-4-7) TaxID=747676 RepID=F4RCX9_MELLP|nr:uncharacterized protein MELLADRAFT_95299 [Melampsora larici-populina 98AG31]EGG09803.1 hypothetical protein MELLADRAFT_95299 [Melampsora larici-populina 98AG31]